MREEIQEIVEKAVDEIVEKVRATALDAFGLEGSKGKRGRKSGGKASPQRQLQGQYIGLVRSKSADVKAKAKKIFADKGVKVAIKFLKNLNKTEKKAAKVAAKAAKAKAG